MKSHKVRLFTVHTQAAVTDSMQSGANRHTSSSLHAKLTDCNLLNGILFSKQYLPVCCTRLAHHTHSPHKGGYQRISIETITNY